MFIEYRGKIPKVHGSAFVAPTAVLIGDVEVGENSSIWFGTVIRGDNGPIRIGARTSVQDNAVVHVSEGSSTIIGNDVTIGHCAAMEDCVIEDGALIGTNSVVLNGATVGRRSLIAAGSVVGAGVEIPAESVAAGAPAKVRKPLDGTSSRWVDHAGPEYVKLSRSYLHQGVGDPEVHEIVEVEAHEVAET
jgi:carbonic anhydrase/acetyltransferase-like protein (isoleucine patch superfamily)